MTVVLNTSHSDLLSFTNGSESEPGQDVPATEMSFTKLMEAYAPEPKSVGLEAAADPEKPIIPKESIVPEGRLSQVEILNYNSNAQELTNIGPQAQALDATLVNSNSLAQETDATRTGVTTNRSVENFNPGETNNVDFTSRLATQTGTENIPQLQPASAKLERANDVLPVVTTAQPMRKAGRIDTELTVSQNKHSQASHLTATQTIDVVEDVKNEALRLPQNTPQAVAQEESISQALKVNSETKLAADAAPENEVKFSAPAQKAPDVRTNNQTPSILLHANSEPETTKSGVTPTERGVISKGQLTARDADSNPVRTVQTEFPVKKPNVTPASIPESKPNDHFTSRIPTFTHEASKENTPQVVTPPQTQVDSTKTLNTLYGNAEYNPAQKSPSLNSPQNPLVQKHDIIGAEKLSHNMPAYEAQGTGISMDKDTVSQRQRPEIKGPSDLANLFVDEPATDAFKLKLTVASPNGITPSTATLSDVLKPSAETAPILFSMNSAPIETTTHRLAPVIGATPLTQPASAQPAALQAVAQNLVHAYATQSGVSIRLDPPEMGNVLINFQFDAERGITAVVRSELAETSVFLKDRAEVLHQALKESGFDSVNLRFEQGQTASHNENSSHKNFPGRYGAEIEFGSAPEEDLTTLSPSRQNTLMTDDQIDLKL